MKCEIQLRVLAAVLTAAVVLADGDFLAEKPPYLKSCKQTDPDFRRCFGNAFEVLFNEWKDGVPGLKTVGSIDPLYIKRITVDQTNNNPVAQLNADLTHIQVRGISKIKIEEASFDSEKLITKLLLSAPKLDMDAQYALNGHILNLALNGNGPSTMSIGDVKIFIAIRLKRRDEHNLVFTDVDKLRLEVTNIGGFHIQLDNLFDGRKDLEDSTNIILNQNWRAIYEVIGPAITNAIQTVMTDRFKKIFAYVPVSYLVEDIPAKN